MQLIGILAEDVLDLLEVREWNGRCLERLEESFVELNVFGIVSTILSSRMSMGATTAYLSPSSLSGGSGREMRDVGGTGR